METMEVESLHRTPITKTNYIDLILVLIPAVDFDFMIPRNESVILGASVNLKSNIVISNTNKQIHRHIG